jgi:hypothetical protein
MYRKHGLEVTSESGHVIFWQPIRRVILFFQNSTSIGELHFSQAFQQYLAYPILILYEFEII